MEKSLSPEEFQELSQSILLDGKEPCSQTVISQGTACSYVIKYYLRYSLISGTSSFCLDVDENVPVVDESVIEDVLQASQSQPNSLCKAFLSLLE
jgi:hypothetical protein